MNVQELLQTIGDRAGIAATIKNVYGEPVIFGDRTVIPVAKVKMGFGGGGGAGRRGEEQAGQGGGGGGGAIAEPCGALEITPEGTRFIYYQDPMRLALAVGIAALAAIFFFSQRSGE
jgi:uncharacterized spore protein YtfJ